MQQESKRMKKVTTVVTLKDGIEKLGKAEVQQKVIAFYSSILEGITTDQALMTVPIDDHMITRGHAVFDTCSVKNGKAYGLSFHLDRLLLSCQKARIVPYQDKETLKQIILETIAITKKRDNIYVRFWMSVGRGDFAVSPTKCKGSNFYCGVHEYTRETGPIKEIIVSVPLKSPILATVKSTNYLVNALAAMEGYENGGNLGIQCDDRGCFAECSIGSIGFVFLDGILRTPFLDRILRGTTLIRAMDLWKEAGVPIKGFVFADIYKSDLVNVTEAITFGGGSVQSIVQIDDKLIGDGKPGIVFQKINELLQKDAENGPFVDDIPY